MKQRRTVAVLSDISGSYISLSGFTLEQTYDHLFQVRAEKNADNFSLNNYILRDTYEQLLKVSASQSDELFSDHGIVNNSVFIEGNYPNAIEYRFAATKNVMIKDNVTNRSIASRDGAQAELSGNLRQYK